MKPFNYEQAIKNFNETGDYGVVTRDGRKVTELYLFKTLGKGYNLSAVIDGQILNFLSNGKYINEDESDTLDLFMETKKIKIMNDSENNVFIIHGNDQNNIEIDTELSYRYSFPWEHCKLSHWIYVCKSLKYGECLANYVCILGFEICFINFPTITPKN